MKKIALVLSFLLFACSAYSQETFQMSDQTIYATIKDKDGFVNVRKSANKNAEIVGTIKNYLVFTCDPGKTDWWKVLFIQRDKLQNPNWIEGYVHKSRISPLLNWTSKSNDIKVIVEKSPYNSKKHKFSNKNQDIFYIDGKRFWGTDGELPKEVIFAVKISYKKTQIPVPDEAFNDLFQPSLKSTTLSIGPDNTFYVRMDNSDGAGGYSIIWIFKDDKYIGRYIDDSEA
ncbi:MAG: SH3 domain-containing protein [Bacteroidota bacterium]|nr:SH3 domain-containing protein [Bacteroidota bacterium]